MVNSRPPTALPGTPRPVVLAEGTELFRLHSARRTATAFNPSPADVFYGGGRFDATAFDAYTYLYAGLTAAAAVCESLLRSVPFAENSGPRLVPKARVLGRRLSFLRLAADLTVLPLVSGQDLAAVAQDAWLTQAEAADYPFTRHWGHWIRAHSSPWAQGFVWPSKREPADRALVLFGDRCPPGVLTESGAVPVELDQSQGENWLNSVLEPYQARLAP